MTQCSGNGSTWIARHPERKFLIYAVRREQRADYDRRAPCFALRQSNAELSDIRAGLDRVSPGSLLARLDVPPG